MMEGSILLADHVETTDPVRAEKALWMAVVERAITDFETRHDIKNWETKHKTHGLDMFFFDTQPKPYNLQWIAIHCCDQPERFVKAVLMKIRKSLS